ncbi:hypothetical protein LTR62_006459 [Meristemomyces frigidus]|uniref:uS12 prolyl 3,4-dihydroxylase n=1 Tax=Meristemomyces frigidus TaxID=1508187 RepID=A0AAN7TBL6_9PEZI|nr:hypothetical protein LTR62_006459 [Meristemomyces frigidus]
MKRKADTIAGAETSRNGHSKKRVATHTNIRGRFGTNVLDSASKYAADYASSTPYKHAVVHDLVDDSLLRSVRLEILENIHFTPKETDIYKIHQSGDLANLDGLDSAALERLPSLLQLRDALYSPEFRGWIQTVSGAGALSGTKTDMAVNVYVPGCHLLCHDDVIGTRRVSYILYLTDPDKPWQAAWGGALRLYPTDEVKGEDGKAYKLPRAEWEKEIPPAWNQLSFFAVQPGESFHDVEEVYHGGDGNDGGRMRMAISGWFHIPQEGEEGFEAGLEERLAEKSSLQQLQGKAEEFDEPRNVWLESGEADGLVRNGDGDEYDEAEDEDEGLTENDLEFLLRFITPNYLTPDTVEELNELFTEESVLQLTNILNAKFSSALREELTRLDSSSLPDCSMRLSRPPHKHRFGYAYCQPAASDANTKHRDQLLNLLLPSLAFKKWMHCVTGLDLGRCTALARRFRRGLDYQLAQGYEGEEAQLEFTLCVTPSKGWGGEEVEAEDDEELTAKEDPDFHANDHARGKVQSNGGGTSNGKNPQPNAAADGEDEANVGGYELYMAGDEADDDDSGSEDGIPIPPNATNKPTPSHTGAGSRRPTTQNKNKPAKSDPAIYKAAAAGEEEDDGILFSNPAGWNTMSVVLRDRGTLRFVKYVSSKARGDRWDFTGGFEVEGEEGDGSGEEEEED